jgi:type IV pilus assembly protein PilC
LQDINSGETLNSAMAKFPSVFDPVYINLVKAGEFSGNLDTTLEKVADQKEKEMAIFSKVRGAMIYPTIILTICIGVVVLLITTVIPQVVDFYRDLGELIPPMTQMLLNISDFVSTKGYLVILLLPFAFLGFKVILRSKAGKTVVDRLILKIPLIGGIVRKSYMSRFTGILGTLVSSGISLNESLEIVKLALNNEVIEKEIEKFIRDVEAGSALGASVRDSREFIPLVGQMIMIGEKTGEVDDMLFRVASYYEKEIDEKVKNIVTIIEPFMMVTMGGLIAFVLGAALLPMYGLINKLNT